tara:strand:+ start:404 stop:832 length:429 start_codon:yes stop_codon:yes gene_type:complete
MKTTEIFTNEPDAIKFASDKSGSIEMIEDVSHILSPEFWAHLAESDAPFAVAIRAHADRVWDGDIGNAWDDALDGSVSGAPSDAVTAIDDQFRSRQVSHRWIVTYDDGAVAPAPTPARSWSPDNTRADDAWGSSSGDGWRCD